MPHPLRVLIVEDSEADATLMQHALRRGGYEVTCEVVDTPAAMRALLENQNWDVITSDHAMPHFSAPAALALAKKLRPDVPFIIVSGELDLNLSVSLMRGGARDYIQKRELPLLIPTIERELREVELQRERQRADAALIESDERYRLLFQSMDNGFALHEMICDAQGVPCDYRFLEINPAFEKLTGLKAKELIGHTNMEMLPGTEKEWIERYGKVALTGEAAHFENYSGELGKYYEVTAYSPKHGQFAVIFRDITRRKQTEEALRQSDTIHKTMIANISDVIAIMAADGTLKYKSPNIEKWFGWLPEDLVGTDGWATVHPDDLERIQKEFWMLLQKDNAQKTVEYRYLCKDGSYKWIELTAVNLTNDPNIHGVLMNYNDITERKQAEETLRESEEKYRLLHESAGVGIGYYTPDGVVISYNTLAAKHMGGKPEDFAGKSLDELFPSAAAGVYMERIRKAAGSHEIQVYEDKIEMPDGVMWFSSSFTRILNSSNQVIGVQIVSSDISKNKQAEEMLLANEANLAEAQQIAHMGSWEWDMVLNTVRWSKEMYRVFDINPATYDGKPESLLKVIHPADIEIFTNSMNSNLSSGQNPALEYRIVHRDGSIHNIVANGRVEFDQNGRPVYSMGTAQDITERKQVEENLRESEAGALRSESRLKMAQSVAHVGDWVWNIKDKQVEWSDEMYRIFGIKKNSYTGRLGDAIAQVIHPDDLHIVQPANASAFAEKKPVQYRILWPDGSIRYIVAETGDAILDGAGAPIYLTGTCQDITERKRVEVALKEDRQRLDSIIKGTNTGTWEWNVQTGETIFNDRWAEIIGYTLDEISPVSIETWINYAHPDDRKVSGELLERHFRGELNYYEFESRMRHKDGTWVWVIDKGKVTSWTGDGKPRLMMGTHQDITERKRAEEKLAETHNLLTNLARLVPSVIYQYQLYPDGRSAFPYSSPGMYTIYEVTPEEVQVDATPVFGRLHPEDYDRVASSIQESARTLEEFYCEYRVILPQQGLRWRWSQAHPERTADGGTLWHGIISDITERKQVEEALRENETKLRKAQQYAHVGSWTWNIQANHLDWSDEMFHIFGLERATFTGSLQNVIASAIHPDDRAKVDQSNLRVSQGKQPSPLEYRVVWPDQSVHVVWAEAGEFVEDEAGNPAQLSGIVQDITERKLAEEQIRQLNAVLEQRVAERTAQLTAANQELEAFSYSVSHDLRAPLRSLDGFSKVLLEDYAGQLDEPGKKYLTRIQVASRRMNQLINDLLEMSRVTRADFTRQRVDLSALANSIATELKTQSLNRRVEFEIAADMIVQGDGNLLKIVLENLLNNACKFTSRREQAIIQVGRVEQDGQWIYFVRDNGAGFNMDYANKLFGAFQRLHSEKEFPGTGIGLATVQRIIHRHGGRVWAEGMVDNGATFYFQFC